MQKTVLVVDDDHDIAELMEVIIERYGYKPVISSSSDIFNNLNEVDPCVIIMDNLLKEGTGNQFCRMLKDDPRTAHYKVILMSGVEDLEQVAQHCSADGFLKKPFPISELRNLLHEMC